MKTSTLPPRRSLPRDLIVFILLCALTGCGEDEAKHHHHATHHHTAPHGGMLIELGDHFANLELVLEDNPTRLTLYVLDSHAANSIPLRQTSIELEIRLPGGEKQLVQLDAVANPLTGEVPGKTSQFSVQTDALSTSGTHEISIRSVVVRGQRFENLEVAVER